MNAEFFLSSLAPRAIEKHMVRHIQQNIEISNIPILHIWKILHGVTSNDVKIKFQPKSRSGIKAVVPSFTFYCMKSHQTLYNNSFAVLGPIGMSKSRLTAFLLIVLDEPPVKGYVSPNSNSLLAWSVDRDAAALWGGREC